MKKLIDKLVVVIEFLFKDRDAFSLLSILLIVIYLVILIFFNEFVSKFIVVIMIFLIISALIAIVSGIIKFLYTDKESPHVIEIPNYAERRKERSEEKIVAQQIKEALLKNPDVLNIEKSIYEKVVSKLEDSLISKLDERFKKDIQTEFISNTIISELIPLTRNTEKYIDRIQRNSIVNLMIGIIGTITSISILAFSILSDNMYSDIGIFLIHFLPRITFIVFIQLFAFFFLRLYKNNLEDAKYFQNELTNLLAKSSALRIAYITKNESLVGEIIKNLSSTERNFKIQKEETLLNIEKAKLEKDFDLEMLSAFKYFLKTYKKE